MIATNFDGNIVTLVGEPGDRIDVDDDGYGIQECTIEHEAVPALQEVVKALNNGKKINGKMIDYDIELTDVMNNLKQKIVSNGKIIEEQRVYLGFSF